MKDDACAGEHLRGTCRRAVLENLAGGRRRRVDRLEGSGTVLVEGEGTDGGGELGVGVGSRKGIAVGGVLGGAGDIGGVEGVGLGGALGVLGPVVRGLTGELPRVDGDGDRSRDDDVTGGSDGPASGAECGSPWWTGDGAVTGIIDGSP